MVKVFGPDTKLKRGGNKKKKGSFSEFEVANVIVENNQILYPTFIDENIRFTHVVQGPVNTKYSASGDGINFLKDSLIIPFDFVRIPHEDFLVPRKVKKQVNKERLPPAYKAKKKERRTIWEYKLEYEKFISRPDFFATLFKGNKAHLFPVDVKQDLKSNNDERSVRQISMYNTAMLYHHSKYMQKIVNYLKDNMGCEVVFENGFLLSARNDGNQKNLEDKLKKIIENGGKFFDENVGIVLGENVPPELVVSDEVLCAPYHSEVEMSVIEESSLVNRIGHIKNRITDKTVYPVDVFFINGFNKHGEAIPRLEYVPGSYVATYNPWLNVINEELNRVALMSYDDLFKDFTKLFRTKNLRVLRDMQIRLKSKQLELQRLREKDEKMSEQEASDELNLKVTELKKEIKETLDLLREKAQDGGIRRKDIESILEIEGKFQGLNGNSLERVKNPINVIIDKYKYVEKLEMELDRLQDPEVKFMLRGSKWEEVNVPINRVPIYFGMNMHSYLESSNEERSFYEFKINKNAQNSRKKEIVSNTMVPFDYVKKLEECFIAPGRADVPRTTRVVKSPKLKWQTIKRRERKVEDLLSRIKVGLSELEEYAFEYDVDLEEMQQIIADNSYKIPEEPYRVLCSLKRQLETYLDEWDVAAGERYDKICAQSGYESKRRERALNKYAKKTNGIQSKISRTRKHISFIEERLKTDYNVIDKMPAKGGKEWFELGYKMKQLLLFELNTELKKLQKKQSLWTEEDFKTMLELNKFTTQAQANGGFTFASNPQIAIPQEVYIKNNGSVQRLVVYNALNLNLELK